MSALTYQDVLNILRLVETGSFSEFEIEFEGTKVKVTRPAADEAARAKTQKAAAAPGARKPEETEAPAAPAVAPAKTQPKAAPVSQPNSQPKSQPAPAVANGVDVKPPMAGTYYCAPSPGAAPYVAVDSRVKKGDQLGMVEVMKLFTAVLAPCDGIVRAILVANEQFVQGDQTLMIIEAAQ